MYQFYAILSRARHRRQRDRQLLDISHGVEQVPQSPPTQPEAYGGPEIASAYDPSHVTETHYSCDGPQAVEAEERYEDEDQMIPRTPGTQACSVPGVLTPGANGSQFWADEAKWASDVYRFEREQNWTLRAPAAGNSGDNMHDDHVQTPRNPSAPPSPTAHSWASGNQTTSVEEMTGLSPPPLGEGRVRSPSEPEPEPERSPSPPRWPCFSRTVLYTCGHAFLSTNHADHCPHDDIIHKAVGDDTSKERVVPCPENSFTIANIDHTCGECDLPPPPLTRTASWLAEYEASKRSNAALFNQRGAGSGH